MLLQKDGPKILQAFSSALNEAGIKFWIDYGTLLGYYRDHDFIGHDNDLDTGAFIEDADRVKDVLEKEDFDLYAITELKMEMELNIVTLLRILQ